MWMFRRYNEYRLGIKDLKTKNEFQSDSFYTYMSKQHWVSMNFILRYGLNKFIFKILLTQYSIAKNGFVIKPEKCFDFN